jgi:glycosyltransferase involved in cell wall biosynthesis
MKVSILVATIDDGIDRVEQVLLTPQNDIRYFVSHQVTEEKYRRLPESLKREDVTISQIEGRGLCRNRNNGLVNAEGDIAIMADDDVRFKPGNFKTVTEAFLNDPEMDVACFKIATPAGEPEYKDYTEFKYLLNDESHHYISTIEIAFRLNSIRKKAITFDERFGLGSKLNSFGEESVFIYDCIKAGLVVKYIPEYLVEHKSVSTIKSTGRFDRVNTVFKGAYDARRYGWLAVPAAFYDMLRFWSEITRSEKTPLIYLVERLQGAIYIFREGGKVNPGSLTVK